MDVKIQDYRNYAIILKISDFRGKVRKPVLDVFYETGISMIDSDLDL